MASTGKLYIISAPSGGGKTTLVNGLVKALDNITVSISYTTRAIRPGEIDGINYHFISQENFELLITQNALLEHARVFDHYYGTARQWVEERLQMGHDVVLEIDWQGAQQIRDLMPEAVGIFILPPSRETLRARLCERAQDDLTIIDRRMAQAKNEIAHYYQYDYLIVNDDFSTALDDLCAIVKAKRLKQAIQCNKYEILLANLLA